MGLFDFILPKKRKKIDQMTVSEIFKMLSPTLKSLWDELVEGQNRAVDMYGKYSRLANKNLYNMEIEYDRILKTFYGDRYSFSLTAGECMYLKLLDLHDDFYIFYEKDVENPIFISFSEYTDLISKLTTQEALYCATLKLHIEVSIKPFVTSASMKRFGIELLQSTIPPNTLECVKYHTYIAEENYFSADAINKWNRISNAPMFTLFGEKISKENPLVPINIKYIDAFILDYLCYATISLPTYDLDRVLRSVPPASNDTVLKMLVAKFGEGIDEYVERAIADMNGSRFRMTAQNGLKISK